MNLIYKSIYQNKTHKQLFITSLGWWIQPWTSPFQLNLWIFEIKHSIHEVYFSSPWGRENAPFIFFIDHFFFFFSSRHILECGLLINQPFNIKSSTAVGFDSVTEISQVESALVSVRAISQACFKVEIVWWKERGHQRVQPYRACTVFSLLLTALSLPSHYGELRTIVSTIGHARQSRSVLSP